MNKFKMIVKETEDYYMDKGRNSWNKEDYTKEEAEMYSKTLMGCYDCIDCEYCTACKECINCEECKFCNDSGNLFYNKYY